MIKLLKVEAVASGFPEAGKTKTLLIAGLFTISFKRWNCFSVIAIPAEFFT